MNAYVSMPIVIVGPIYNGTREHAAIVTRVFSTEPLRATVNATMFPDGGGDGQAFRELHLYPTREAALNAGTARVAGYFVTPDVAPAPPPPAPPAPAPEPEAKRGPGRPRKA